MGYKRDDVQTHSDGFRSRHPAVNVKCRHMFGSYKLREAWESQGYREEAIEKALGYCWEAHCESFWESAEDYAREALKRPVKVYSEGRSGGWLVVHGLPDLDSWDGPMLSRWRGFENTIKREVACLCSDDAIRESVEANGWLGDTVAQAGIGTSDEWLQA